MKFTFLAADKPMRKSYELDTSGELVKHSYPFVYDVSSTEISVLSLSGLLPHLQRHAKLGNCLLKGNLGRPLVSESRAGSTNPDEKTDWICLDLDGVTGHTSPDTFLSSIGCGDVDYILQWSSSMGIENNNGLRCHILMLLDKPVHPQVLKHWLMNLNLTEPTLSKQIELTKTGNALRWPLDVTTCQNDKLLYIAPPLLDPKISDPFPKNKRISFHARSQPALTLPYPVATREAVRLQADTKISELRAGLNLPKRKTTKYKFAGTVEYMASPDAATITDMKTERGFVYFNLNSGDSWAYYHPVDNPNFVFNFKGEPTYRTEDLLPEYWARIRQSQMNTPAPNASGVIYLAFRDFKTSNYFNGTYNTATDQLELAQAKSETQLRDFLKQHGRVLGDFIEDWNLVWDPHVNTVVDVRNKTVNTYQPSNFYFLPPTPPPPAIPPTCLKVISHVLGHDQPTIDHFINWLAVIVQHRTKTGTAWILHGTEGTGKGVLFHSIITPLLGEQNVVSKRMEELESEFTGFMENKFAVFIDEVEAGNSLYHSRVTAKLKNLIVEPTISVRKMYTPAYMAVNYANLIFASNKNAPVDISPDDRRYNVAPYQTTPIILSSQEVDTDIPAELEGLFHYLRTYPAASDRARKPLQSTARSTLIHVSRTALDSVIDAVLSGNLEWLWDHLPADPNTVSPLIRSKHQAFRDLIVNIVNTQDPVLTRDDLYSIAEWCVGNMPTSPNKFTAVLKHHRVHLTQVWKNGRNLRGIKVVWNVDPNWLAQAVASIQANLV